MSKEAIHRAKRIVSKLVANGPESIVCKIFMADIRVFNGDMCEAEQEYKATKLLLKVSKGFTEEDRRFLLAYVNYRIIAVGVVVAKPPFRDAMYFVHIINNPEAHLYLKSLFRLPE